MSPSEISQLLIAISLSFAIIGISIQIIRLLGTTNDTLQDVRHVAFQISAIIDGITKEVGAIKNTLTNFNGGVSQIKSGLIDPLIRMSTIIGSIVNMFNNRFGK